MPLLNVVSEAPSAVLFFMPAYIANAAPTIFGGGTVLDFGKNFADGRRIFGNGKTWRGSAVGIFSGTFYKVLENMAAQKPFSAQLMLAFSLSFGAIFGDILASFVKRRAGFEKGESAPLLDQLDFVVGGLFFASFFARIEPETVFILLLITPALHLAVNMLGYVLKKKEVPW